MINTQNTGLKNKAKIINMNIIKSIILISYCILWAKALAMLYWLWVIRSNIRWLRNGQCMSKRRQVLKWEYFLVMLRVMRGVYNKSEKEIAMRKDIHFPCQNQNSIFPFPSLQSPCQLYSCNTYANSPGTILASSANVMPCIIMRRGGRGEWCERWERIYITHTPRQIPYYQPT